MVDLFRRGAARWRTVSGTSTRQLCTTCANTNADSPAEVAALLGDVNVLVDDDHCTIDTSGKVSASITASNSRPLPDCENHAGGGNICFGDDAFVAQQCTLHLRRNGRT